jgi:hypothetical protein
MTDSRRPIRGIEFRDLAFNRTALGATTVRGTLWPSGKPFVATLIRYRGDPAPTFGRSSIPIGKPIRRRMISMNWRDRLRDRVARPNTADWPR